MDQLRRDIRAVYDRQQAILGDVAGTRRRLMASALEKRDEPIGARLQLAAGIAAVALAVVVVATFAYVRAVSGRTEHPVAPATSPSATRPSPTAQSSPRPAGGMWTVAIDLLDASNGWVLLSNCIQPMTGKCHYFVSRTVDGAHTWSKVVQVGPSFAPSDGDAPRSIRFTNARDGFVYGGTVGFVTHDGGRSWGNFPGLHPTFYVTATGLGARYWIVTYPCAKGTVCPYEVRSSTDAGRSWSAPLSLPTDFNTLGAFTIGTKGLLISSEPTGDMEMTLDDGASWQRINTRCTGNVYRGIAATADGNELWELCLNYPNYPTVQTATERLFVSEDGGKTWALRTTSQVSGEQVQVDYLTVLTSIRPGTALMASPRSTIAISHDSGVTWTKVGPTGVGFTFIRFADTTNGWALDVNGNVWATSDSGDHWSQLPGTWTGPA